MAIESIQFHTDKSHVTNDNNIDVNIYVDVGVDNINVVY
jgi:hypothetical protein